VERKAVFMYSSQLEEGGFPPSCPFNSSRPVRTRKTIQSLGLMNYSHTTEVAPLPTSRDQMEWFHKTDYLDTLLKCSMGEYDYTALQMGLGTPDTPLFKNMYEYLTLACGGTTTGARLIIEKKADIVFNTAGGFHHAGPQAASGFCYINDVVLAAHMLAEAGMRVAVLDLDVHHGDGTQDAFYNRSDVLTISLHESGDTLFPGTGYVNECGEQDGKGYNVNFPLPVGTYDNAYYKAVQEVVLPVLKRNDPDVIVLVLGMDALAGDPLAHLNLTNSCYADVVADVVELDKPILATGGGGYNVENTVRGWALLWNVLSNGRFDDGADFGLGGVMLENTAWLGGLRDKTLLSYGGFRDTVDAQVQSTIDEIKKVHG
jgi:acetoin utilization protein AcuC